MSLYGSQNGPAWILLQKQIVRALWRQSDIEKQTRQLEIQRLLGIKVMLYKNNTRQLENQRLPGINAAKIRHFFDVRKCFFKTIVDMEKVCIFAAIEPAKPLQRCSNVRVVFLFAYAKQDSVSETVHQIPWPCQSAAIAWADHQRPNSCRAIPWLHRILPSFGLYVSAATNTKGIAPIQTGCNFQSSDDALSFR